MNPSVLSTTWPGRLPHIRRLASGQTRAYVRFVALGDSATCGFGDPISGGLRGWSRMLAEAIAQEHDISYCNLAVPGSTAEDVWLHQVCEAVDHRPHMASLIVGLNDTLRSDWEANDVRDRLLRAADELAWCGCALLTVRFHDHGRVLGLPGVLARPLAERIEQLNQVYDEIHRDYGTIHLDLTDEPVAYDRRFWMVDRLHPSEFGHRFLAHRFAHALATHGLDFTPPSLTCTSSRPSLVENLCWLFTAGGPWVRRRAGDWGPALTRQTWDRIADRMSKAAPRPPWSPR